jgi:hypothetical protein
MCKSKGLKGDKAVMATPTQTSTAAEQKRTVEEKIQKIRELFADAPELGRRALENVLVLRN